MSLKRFDPESIRAAILQSLPEQSFAEEQPEIRYLYVPHAHARALHPDTMLVRGIRGAGKSFWWGALRIPEYRKLAADVLSDKAIEQAMEVTPGFGAKRDPESYPSKDVLAGLLDNFEPRLLWRTVVLWHVAATRLPPYKKWSERLSWVKDHAEDVDELFYAVDQFLATRRKKHLVLFDALDNAADGWDHLRRLVRGLLQVLLEFRSYRAIRVKAFLRPDMLDDREVTAFPDASKVITNAVDLSWPRTELFGLLWQHLANAPGEGTRFRKECKILFEQKFRQVGNVWVMPEEMRRDDGVQRNIFHAIAGPSMGKDNRRGFPYTWLPNHLSDAYGQTSPRSFLWAIRTAAGAPPHTDYSYGLYYESIKRGVQAASEIRVEELNEDFPWTKHVMKPLDRLVIPCTFEAIEARWQAADILRTLNAEGSGTRLPRRLRDAYQGIRKDLEEIGLLQTTPDGRINMPDVYRVGFGVGRKGGVKPLR